MQTLKAITGQTAADLIIRGQPVRDIHITGELRIDEYKRDGSLFIENCIVDKMMATAVDLMNLQREQICSGIRTNPLESISMSGPG